MRFFLFQKKNKSDYVVKNDSQEPILIFMRQKTEQH
jgi:hypothetical protein